MKSIFYKLLLSLSSTVLLATPHCNYKATDQALYIKQQYQYKPGNINDPCVKVFTITDYMAGEDTNVVEIPTKSSWVFTENSECRCVDLKQPESLWNKTFPKNEYTTKDVLLTLKAYANKDDYWKHNKKDLVIEQDKSNFKVEELIRYNKNKNINKEVYITKIDKNYSLKVDEKIIKSKKNINNIFITNSTKYIKEFKIKKGNYMVSFTTSPDINVVQVFNQNLEKLKEFRLYEPFSTETNFFISLNEDSTISIMSLNPQGKGFDKGITNIRTTKIKK